MPPQQQGQIGTNAEAQTQRPAPKPLPGYHKKAAAPIPSATRGDASKLTCYRCGKTGHITTDPKCPQFKKPEQRQIFAAQVLDDRSDGEQPEQTELLDGQGREPEPSEEGHLDGGAIEQPEQDYCPDGSQYEDEERPYDDYDGYEQPSDSDEPIYIRAMSDEDPNVVSALEPFDDVDWRPRRDVLQRSYQRAPWMSLAGPNSWEFRPCHGITHIQGCSVCASYKEHLLVAEALGDKTTSSAWGSRDNYEQELI